LDLALLAAAGSATALATGLGAIPVWLVGSAAVRLQPILWGFAAGTMGVAAVAGLLLPGFREGTTAEVLAGALLGAVFVLAARTTLQGHQPRGGMTPTRSLLVFGVLLVHSLPEGFALGTAFASETGGLALFVFVAIAVQNIPEGTSMAVPMAVEGRPRADQFWTAVATSLPQPIGAVLAFLAVESIGFLLPLSFGFAAGAMLVLIAAELLPQSLVPGRRAIGVAGVAGGAALMLLLDLLLGV
jgi:ZIP family zinc transporter